ncbi:hypothetical protein PPYR_07745 [Photinus pyralis]|uniref:Eukaryotic translation initiation factor 5 n=1 Tax=Photinus pyralis TaxID=7054 RepID=A0A1Y1L6V3_PHOPY|nr:eukaryotic translation initiation factor 5 [Photinus pyralis]XP_031341863.1 eukaryotic translation initiation factor 5 [Photinus pyralis]XP_031341865.1 eukaryotic translation initiation factor 5 [Photinus pyralis]KAB0799865.1 hypothetical protein PPYR_07745 [Photinus pyralis]
MGSVNVNRNVSDLFYRYKMPPLVAKVEGKGNGIKTVIVNMSEVAKALSRPPTYPTKYFGCELGAQTQFDFKNERFIVNGSHDAVKLQDLLDGFIRKFVLCPECDNPETDLIVSAKRGTISQGCKACGFHGPLEFNHKLNTYILKNPPNMNPAVQGSSLTEGKKRTKRSKKANGDNANGDGQDQDGEPIGLDASVDVTSNDNGAGEDDDTEWAVDVSEEAVRARMQDLTDGAKNITISDDLERPEKERVDILYEMVKAKRDAGVLDSPQSQKELVNEAERLDIKVKTPLILAELLFDQNILTQAKRHRMLILRFTLNDKKAQKYLIGGLEQVIAMHSDVLMNKVPGLLKVFYDLDILGENVIMEWAEKVSKKYVSKDVSQEIHNKAAPFIKWLKEAEEEESSESEEESDEDVEIEYNERAQITPLKPVAKPPVKKPQVDDDDENDVDIDAI